MIHNDPNQDVLLVQLRRDPDNNEHTKEVLSVIYEFNQNHMNEIIKTA